MCNKVGEIRLGGTYSNQVALLEAKIDALTLDVRSIEDKLDIVLLNLPKDNTSIEKILDDWYARDLSSCECGDKCPT